MELANFCHGNRLIGLFCEKRKLCSKSIYLLFSIPLVCIKFMDHPGSGLIFALEFAIIVGEPILGNSQSTVFLIISITSSILSITFNINDTQWRELSSQYA